MVELLLISRSTLLITEFITRIKVEAGYKVTNLLCRDVQFCLTCL